MDRMRTKERLHSIEGGLASDPARLGNAASTPQLLDRSTDRTPTRERLRSIEGELPANSSRRAAMASVPDLLDRPTWRAFVVDDVPGRYEPALRQGAKEHNIELVSETAYTLGSAIARIWTVRPDLVFIDLGGVFPQVSRDWSEPIAGFISLAVLRTVWPRAAYVVVSRLCEPRLVGPLVQPLGAMGY